MSIGERVKKTRLEQGISQITLAEACGCTQQEISNLERGFAKSPGYLPDLARILEVSEHWLRTGREGVLGDDLLVQIRARQRMETGRRIRDTREALGISKKDLCDRLGVNLEMWQAWEGGEADPDHYVIIQWHRWHGVTLDWIFMGIGHSLPYSLIEKLTDLDLRRRHAASHLHDND